MNEHIGRFELLKKIGSGGMADIYIARQHGVEGFEKLVVIKKLRPELTKNSQFMHMFVNEAKLAARLNHPNIVQIFDLGFTAGTYFIAMEYIFGEDLISLIKACRKRGIALPMHYSLRIVSQTCEGLHFAHTKTDVLGNPLKIVHCDVSPQNIVISFDGAVKVIDFGVAKAATLIEDASSKNQIRGKLSYMSPEQCTGGHLDARSDLFSLGVVLWELITGRRLYGKLGTKEIIMAVAKAEIPPPRKLNPAVPERLENLVMRALARRPEDRFASAEQMCQELEAFIKSCGWGVTSLDLASFMRELFQEKLQAMKRYLASQATTSELETVLFTDVGSEMDFGRGDDPTGSSIMPVAEPAVRPSEKKTKRTRRFLGPRLFAFISLFLGIAALIYFFPRLTGLVENLLKALGRNDQVEASGVVEVVSTPAGASVWLDNQERGVTPCKLSEIEQVTEHSLEVSMDGYEPFNFRFRLSKPGEERVFKVLLSKQEKVEWARVRIETSPPGATVELNGSKQKGKTPLLLDRITPNRTNKLVVQLPGHQQWQTTFKLNPRESQTIRANLIKIPPGSP